MYCDYRHLLPCLGNTAIFSGYLYTQTGCMERLWETSLQASWGSFQLWHSSWLSLVNWRTGIRWLGLGACLYSLWFWLGKSFETSYLHWLFPPHWVAMSQWDNKCQVFTKCLALQHVLESTITINGRITGTTGGAGLCCRASWFRTLHSFKATECTHTWLSWEMAYWHF